MPSKSHSSVNSNLSTFSPQQLTRFTSKVTFHGNDEELLNQLKVCVTSALKTYFKLNATYPNKIIVYRDGVGDRQIEYVKEVSFFTKFYFT